MVHKPIVLGSIILSCFFTAFSCKSEKEIATPVKTTEQGVEKIKYLALGDSYTKGESVPQQGSFPYQLKDSLENNYNIHVEKLQVLAQTGWTTTNLLSAIKSAAITDTFSLVSLLIGVNNQYQKKPITVYEAEFLQLLQQAINFAGNNKNRVVVLSIPDYGATPFGQNNAQQIGKEIDEYNAINKRITDSLSITYFNITPISRQAKAQPNLVATDGLHPSANMYALWVDLMLGEINRILRQ